MNVYVVEDSRSIRERLSEMVVDIGATVVGEAVEPASAVLGILKTQPDSVILDLQLEGGSGLDVLRAVHPSHPEILFITVTNFPNAQYRRSCFAAGATHFLDKNTEFSRVREVLRELAPNVAATERLSSRTNRILPQKESVMTISTRSAP